MYRPDKAEAKFTGEILNDPVITSDGNKETVRAWGITNQFYDPSAPEDIQHNARYVVGFKGSGPIGKEMIKVIKKGRRCFVKGSVATRRTYIFDHSDEQPKLLQVQFDGLDIDYNRVKTTRGFKFFASIEEWNAWWNVWKKFLPKKVIANTEAPEAFPVALLEKEELLMYVTDVIGVTDTANYKDRFELESVGTFTNDPSIKTDGDREIAYLRFITNPFRRKYNENGEEIDLLIQNMLRTYFGVVVKNRVNKVKTDIKKRTRAKLEGLIGAVKGTYSIILRDGSRFTMYDTDAENNIKKDANGNPIPLERIEPRIHLQSYMVIDDRNNEEVKEDGVLQDAMRRGAETETEDKEATA